MHTIYQFIVFQSTGIGTFCYIFHQMPVLPGLRFSLTFLLYCSLIMQWSVQSECLAAERLRKATSQIWKCGWQVSWEGSVSLCLTKRDLPQKVWHLETFDPLSFIIPAQCLQTSDLFYWCNLQSRKSLLCDGKGSKGGVLSLFIDHHR